MVPDTNAYEILIAKPVHSQDFCGNWGRCRDFLRLSKDVELDIFRRYVLIYQWVKAISADEAFAAIAGKKRRRILEILTESVRRGLEKYGYIIVGYKPAHIIERLRKNGAVLRQPVAISLMPWLTLNY